MRYFVLLLFCTFVFSCIDPYPYDTPANERIMVVDGLISTDSLSHEIILSYANQYSNVLEGNRIPMGGAQVSIVEDDCNEIVFQEEIKNFRWFCAGGKIRPGQSSWTLVTSSNFQVISIKTGKYIAPKGFMAKVGSTYILKIIAPNGQEYQSTPQTIRKVSNLNDVITRNFDEATINPLIDRKGIELIASFSDPSEEENHYLWRASNATIEFVAEPEQYTYSFNDPVCPGCLAPLSCCPVCFMSDVESPKWFTTTSDRLFNGLDTKQILFKITDDGIRFKSRYGITINQFSINEEVYGFLKLVRQQLEIQGSVFDPPPANIRGNIKNITDPDMVALGIFIAADVSSKTIYISRDDIPREFRAPRRVLPMDCRNYCGRLQEPPSISPPAFWEYN